MCIRDRKKPKPESGRPTAESAFDTLRREIAQRNEEGHRAARKLRNERERKQMLIHRQRDV